MVWPFSSSAEGIGEKRVEKREKEISREISNLLAHGKALIQKEKDLNELIAHYGELLSKRAELINNQHAVLQEILEVRLNTTELAQHVSQLQELLAQSRIGEAKKAAQSIQQLERANKVQEIKIRNLQERSGRMEHIEQELKRVDAQLAGITAKIRLMAPQAEREFKEEDIICREILSNILAGVR